MIRLFKCFDHKIFEINKFQFYFIRLAGTIGSEPEPIESRQFGSKDKLATAGIFGSGGKGKQNDTEYPSTPQPPGSTVPPHPPTTDENMIYGMLSDIFSIMIDRNH